MHYHYLLTYMYMRHLACEKFRSSNPLRSLRGDLWGIQRSRGVGTFLKVGRLASSPYSSYPFPSTFFHFSFPSLCSPPNVGAPPKPSTGLVERCKLPSGFCSEVQPDKRSGAYLSQKEQLIG